MKWIDEQFIECSECEIRLKSMEYLESLECKTNIINDEKRG